jgi:pimeloyl-ACP methyl ester carboxylesterase
MLERFSLIRPQLFPGPKSGNKLTYASFQRSLDEFYNCRPELDKSGKSFWKFVNFPIPTCWVFPSSPGLVIHKDLEETDMEASKNQQTVFDFVREDSPIPFVFIFFHGNGCDLSSYLDFYFMLGNFCNSIVIAIEYPGYSEQQDFSCTTNNIVESSLLGLEFVWNMLACYFVSPDVNPEDHNKWKEKLILRTFLIGHSLGCAIALKVAQGIKNLGGLFLFSPFTTCKDVMKRCYPKTFSVLGNVISKRFDNCVLIEQTKCPVCIISGMNDEITPPSMSESLFALARLNSRRISQWVIVDELGHALPQDSELVVIMPSLVRFLEKCILFPGVQDSHLVQTFRVDLGQLHTTEKSYWNNARRQFLSVSMTRYKKLIQKRFGSIPNFGFGKVEESFFSLSAMRYKTLWICISRDDLQKRFGNPIKHLEETERNLEMWAISIKAILIVLSFLLFCLIIIFVSYKVNSYRIQRKFF